MGISKNITVTAAVDGEYTLSELLDTLGDKKALKKALTELEVKSKQARQDILDADDAMRKSAVKIKKERAEIAAEWADVKKQSDTMARMVATFEEKKAALDSRDTALSVRQSDTNARTRDLNDFKASLAAKEKELDRRDQLLDLAMAESGGVKSEYEEKLERLKQAID